MSSELTITRAVHFGRGSRSRKVLREGEAVAVVAGKVPRISRLMALAIRMEDFVRSGEVADYADLARLGHVSRPRVTQIMNLLHLAPDIQEAILSLPDTDGGRATVTERKLRSISAVVDWHQQRKMWRDVRRK